MAKSNSCEFAVNQTVTFEKRSCRVVGIDPPRGRVWLRPNDGGAMFSVPWVEVTNANPRPAAPPVTVSKPSGPTVAEQRMLNLEKARIAKAAKAAARTVVTPPPVVTAPKPPKATKPPKAPKVTPTVPVEMPGVHITKDGKVYASKVIRRAAKRAAVAAGQPHENWRAFIGSDGPDFDGGPQARFDGMTRDEIRQFYAEQKRATPPEIKDAVAEVKATTPPVKVPKPRAPKPEAPKPASVEPVSIKERLDMLEGMMLRMMEFMQANTAKA